MRRTRSLSIVLAAWLATAVLSQARTTPNRTPHEAAQEGIEWLQKAALEWQKDKQCFGCHAQAQVIMGLSVAKRNKYIVSDRTLKELVQFVGSRQNADGTFGDSAQVTATQFAAMATAYYDEITGVKSPLL